MTLYSGQAQAFLGGVSRSRLFLKRGCAALFEDRNKSRGQRYGRPRPEKHGVLRRRSDDYFASAGLASPGVFTSAPFSALPLEEQLAFALQLDFSAFGLL
jgi:hypothetical protein